jgi:hypothetical protein
MVKQPIEAQYYLWLVDLVNGIPITPYILGLAADMPNNRFH